MSSFITRIVDQIDLKGFAIVKSELLGEVRANLLRKQLKPYMESLNLNDVSGVAVISNSQYIEFPLAISPELTECVLDATLVNIVSRYFNGGEIRLTSCRIQRRISGASMPPHRDFGDSIVVLHYLSKPTIETGVTTFYVGSHKSKIRGEIERVNDASYISEEIISERYDTESMEGYEAGSVVIYSSNLIHSIPRFKKPGREIIMSIFCRVADSRSFYFRHILTSDSIRCLTSNQRKIIGIEDTIPVDSPYQFKPFQITLSYDPSYKYSFLRRLIWIARFIRERFAGGFR